jgi:hypothetical protein
MNVHGLARKKIQKQKTPKLMHVYFRRFLRYNVHGLCKFTTYIHVRVWILQYLILVFFCAVSFLEIRLKREVNERFILFGNLVKLEA